MAAARLCATPSSPHKGERDSALPSREGWSALRPGSDGHGVGPELDGAGRDIDYLLVNVLDPNRVVGQPYFIRRVMLTSGRIEEGLLVSEDPQAITLKGENDAQKTIPKKEVAEVEVIEKSMMPEGLGNAMTVQDFRDLVRYVMANPFLTDVAVAGPFDLKTTPSPGEAGIGR